MPEYKYARVRGFAPWSPSRKSAALINTVLRVLDVEAEYLPLTVRQVFYRLVASHGYQKTENAYASLCEKINRGRRAGLVPWDAIRDDGESVYSLGPHTGHHRSPFALKSHIHRQAANFNLHASDVQPCVVEVHVEAAGMLPQVARVCGPLGVNAYSSGGFGSATTQFEAARRFASRSVPTVVLSVGDYDPSGVSLYWSWRENVLRFFAEGTEFLGTEWDGPGTTRLGVDMGMYEDPVAHPLFRRIAVTPAQIREHGFVTAPAKKTDRRGDWDGETVQCEAIPSALLVDIVRDAILDHYDEDAVVEVDRLAEGCRGDLVKAFGDAQVTPLNTRVREGLSAIRKAVGHDWTGGYSNDDEINMEEGI